MNPYFSVVKEEYSPARTSGGTSPEKLPAVVVQPPQPMEGLHDAGPPPFLTKVYDMVDDENIDHILSWSKGGQSFVVWDLQAFSSNLLPRYFKHNNFSSFIRQLNTYGFRKIDSDIWEFSNEAFLKGQRHILKNIKRRKPTSHPSPQQQATNPCGEVGRFGLDGEVERLKRDKHVLMMELVKLRQHQQKTRVHLQEMEMRLQVTEKKQQKTMSFLAKALQNPEFVKKVARHNERKQLEEAMIKKRRLIDQGESSKKGEEFGGLDLLGYFHVSELEQLALEMQGIGRYEKVQEEKNKEINEFNEGDKIIDEQFLEDLFDEQFVLTGSEGGKGHRFDFFGSSEK